MNQAAKIHVLIYGLGPIGIQILQQCLRSERLALIGAVDIDPGKIGQDIGELAGGKPIGLRAVSSVEEIAVPVSDGRKVAIQATGSNLEQVWPQIRQLLDAGFSVVSTCEQLSYPWHRYPRLSAEIDRYARQTRHIVVGTGVNPGFVMDSLALYLTSVTNGIHSIAVSRKVDVARRRVPLQKKVGIGMTAEQFQALAREERIGHVGLEESLRLIAYGLELTLEDVQNRIEPTLAEKDMTLAVGPLRAGEVSGMHQVSRGTTAEGVSVELDLTMAVGAAQEDRITVRSDEMPPLSLVIPNGIFGDTATANIAVNTVKTVHSFAADGLLTMADLPIIRNSK
ncbi:hypothetical protein [Paenibacillus sp. 1P07SE]|uniref:NAD(P)H-dependent amine dehydrogenase family protein n=1 Tax=Paenibacillus sp. 1P07SE TaxID=3132209 RepID=UPI0039A5EDCE